MAEVDFGPSVSSLVYKLEEMYQDWGGVKQLKGTPGRLLKMYGDMLWSPGRIRDELAKQFKVFENDYNEMLVEGPIEVWTLCPHHLLPCCFTVTIGYIPNGSVLGLSKFTRIAVILGKRPILQEEYTTELVDELDKGLKPLGVAAFVVGKHGCMLARGVKQPVDVTTSVLKGVFLTNPDTKAEFLALARGR